MYGYIYKTVNLINKKIYIGQKKSTIFLANKYLGSGKYLKNALNKYGAQNFKVYLIEECSSKQILNDREIYWISYYKKNGYILYNISSGGDGGDTYIGLSEEERQKRIKKVSQNCYFRHCTSEDRKKAWETRRKNGNDKFSIEYRTKLSKSHLGNKRSKESIQKGIQTRNQNYNGRYRHSKETINKIKLGNIGKSKNISEEGLAKLKECGRTRVKDKNGFYGKTHSETTRNIISETSLHNWRNNKYKWMHNENVSIRVPERDIINYLNLGYILGRGAIKR